MMVGNKLMYLLLEGLTPTQATDYLLVKECGMPVEVVADARDVSEKEIEMNVDSVESDEQRATLPGGETTDE